MFIYYYEILIHNSHAQGLIKEIEKVVIRNSVVGNLLFHLLVGQNRLQ